MMELDGGKAIQITDVAVGVHSFAVSPGSRSIVFRASCCGGQPNERTLVICEFPTCTTRRPLHVENYAGGRVRWAPDGRGVAYVGADRQANIWIQPLAGSPARPLTHFSNRTIADFAWSPDGRQLAIARATTTNDVVLFKD